MDEWIRIKQSTPAIFQLNRLIGQNDKISIRPQRLK